MAKLSKKDLEDVIKQQAKGFRVAEHTEAEDSVKARVRPEEGTPDVDYLRRKYGKEQGEASEESEAKATKKRTHDSVSNNPGHNPRRRKAKDAKDDQEPEDTMVALEPDAPPNPWDHGAKPKVVVVSGKDKRIISSQG